MLAFCRERRTHTVGLADHHAGSDLPVCAWPAGPVPDARTGFDDPHMRRRGQCVGSESAASGHGLCAMSALRRADIGGATNPARSRNAAFAGRNRRAIGPTGCAHAAGPVHGRRASERPA